MTREGLADDAVQQLIEDDHGHLWIGTRAGLMRVALDHLHEFLAGTRRVITGTLAGLPERANAHKVHSPALLILGEVAALAEALHWFGAAPLGDAPAPAPLLQAA
jgi:hypothetical protein